MEQFRIIYRILKVLQQAMDAEAPDCETISAKTLGISMPMWINIMCMLVQGGYISGVKVVEYDGGGLPIVYMTRPMITLKGLAYLEENSMMRKAANLAKGNCGLDTLTPSS